MSGDEQPLHPLRNAVIYCSIVANALFAGGIFIFPILTPALVSHLRLTQPQLTTIVLAGMVGQYPFSVFVGYVVDRHGPAVCSLVASVMFSVAFGCFSAEVSNATDDTLTATFYKLTLCFFIAGLGTVFSYFSLLFAAARCLPNHPGIASGLSTSVFGLSPLFLSLLASNFFTTPEGLQVIPFLRFLAISAGIVHLCGAVTLQSRIAVVNLPSSTEANAEPDERTSLITQPSTESNSVMQTCDATLSQLLSDPFFWVLFMTCLLSLGYCEMVISNIGTIVLSLHQSVVPQQYPAETLASQQVKLLSLSNTLSRVAVGPLADFISPIASHLQAGIHGLPSHHRISRIAFISLFTALLACTCLFMTLVADGPKLIWLLSVGTGISYGSIFTLLPSIVSSIWGVASMGRNFGVLTYAPFLGTPIFSYLYAFISARHTADGGVCYGPHCWVYTFWFSFCAIFTALITSLLLWRVWRGRL